jgi:hypothetical protein
MHLLNLKYLISMYLFLQCEVTIGKVVIRHVNDIEVKSSWQELTDTATITLPRELNYKDQRIDKLIKRADPVTIKLAYTANGITTWVTEFEGYVREIEPNVPLKVYCEDEMFKLKGGTLFNKLWKNAKLKDIIATVAPGYATNVIDATLSYRAQNKTAAQILADLREYIVYSYFRTVNGVKTLHSGFAYNFNFNSHIFHLQQNTRPGNNLKYRLQVDPTVDDAGIVIKAITHNSDGSKTEEYYPSQSSKGELITMPFSELSPVEATRRKLLKQYAQAEFKRLNIDGYRGGFTAFALPVVRHGDTVTIRDAQYPEREGKYYVDGTITRFNAESVQLIRDTDLGGRATV